MDISEPPDDAELWRSRTYELMQLFSPGAPIDEADLFAGRRTEIDKMIDAVMSRGQHAILYGERGVGKSSLANTFSTRLISPVRTLASIPVNCHPSDDFSQVWRKVFRRLAGDDGADNLAAKYPGEIHPDDVVIELSRFSANATPIVILDEFDQLKDSDARNLIANTIKNLSDRSTKTTVILVGVADSVSELIAEHESISRCLKQIPMRRMTASELREIINQRLPRVDMTISEDALEHIVALSRRLPHYTHLIGQRSAKKALEGRSLNVDLRHVEESLPECVAETQQTIRAQYHKATTSPRRENIYKEVILAAALAEVDELGYFQPASLCEPLTALLQRTAPVSLFGQHLKTLCQEERATMLEQTGSERKYRYRFVEPLMQPFVLIQGLRGNLITREQIQRLGASHYEQTLSSEF